MGHALAAVHTHHAPIALFSRLADTLRHWRVARQEQTELSRFNERELHDIGLTRTDQIRILSVPFWRS